MIHIENKTVLNESETITYHFLLLNCIKCLKPDRSPFNYEEIKSRIKAEDALVEEVDSPGIFKVEDSDFEIIKSLVKSASWNISAKFIVEFVEYILSLKPIEKNIKQFI